MGLRAEVSADEDLAAFRDHIRSFDRTWFSRDRNGEIVCCIAARSAKLRVLGKTVRYVNADYAFSRLGLQRVPLPFFCCCLFVLRHFLLRPFARWYVTGPTYPYSYIVFRLGASKCLTLGQASRLPAFERETIQAFARAICGQACDSGSGLVRMRTNPKFDLPRHLLNPEQEQSMRSYLQENPDWQKGFTLFAMLPINSGLILRRFLSAPWRFLTRARHGRGPRRGNA